MKSKTFDERVKRKSGKLISSKESEHERLTESLVEKYAIYQRGRNQCLDVAILIHQLGVWSVEYNLFVDYLMDKLNIQKTYAYGLIKAAKITEDNPDDPPANERRARAISDNKNNGHSDPPKSEEKEESEISNTTDKKFRHGGIENSVKPESEPPSKPRSTTTKKEPIVVDDVGTPIPMDALPCWNRKKEVKALMDAISYVKCEIEKAKSENDVMYGGVSNNFILDMRAAYTHLKDGAYPYAVCTQCMGSPTLQPDGCSFCRNTGLISEWRWNTQAIKEIKEMRIKIAAELAAKRK